MVLLSCAGIACSGIPRSFCVTHNERNSDLVVKGAIVAAGSQSIQLAVFEVLHGAESRSVITIWDGKDFDCNGLIPMKVSDLGSVGDTILAVLPEIKVVINDWDVLGDYSRPHWLYYEPVLKVKSDTIRGFISGNQHPSGPIWQVSEMKYSELKSYWTQNQGDCIMLTGIAETKKQEEPHIFQDQNLVSIFIPGNTTYEIRITSLQGRLISTHNTTHELVLDLQNYAHGMYVITLQNGDGRVYRKKLVK